MIEYPGNVGGSMCKYFHFFNNNYHFNTLKDGFDSQMKVKDKTYPYNNRVP